MDRKSIAQEYYTLTVDENGNMPSMHKEESYAGLVAAGFMDFLVNNVITADKNKISVIKENPGELAHLALLYAYLNERPRSIDKLMSDYYTGSRIKQLTAQIGESLKEEGKAAKGTGGLFGPKTTYIPEKNYKDELIGMIKSAITTGGEITSHDIALIYILKETKNLNQYFSKHEISELKAKLKEMKNNPQNKQLADMINYVSDTITVIMACVLLYSM